MYKYVLKEMAKNIFSSKGMMSVSLPVNTFDKSSMLNRFVDIFGYAH